MTAKTATDILDTLIDQGKVKTYAESPRSIAVTVARNRKSSDADLKALAEAMNDSARQTADIFLRRHRKA